VVKIQRIKSVKYTILVVDDEESIRHLVVSYLSKLGHSCLTAVDGVDTLDKIKENKIDAVITDIKLPNMDGMTLIGEISRQYPGLPVMVMTAFDEEYSEGTVISVGAREFLKKPFTLDEFAVRLNKMINDSEIMKRMKTEKAADEDLRNLLEELERVLKNS
jgi:DNA-binding response OmpR family regulator